MAASFPKINGNAYSWVSVQASFGKFITAGLKELKYSRKVKVKKEYGNSTNPILRTRGMAEYEASGVMWREAYDELLAVLGDKTSEKEFDITVQYREGTKTTTDTLVSVRIIEDESGGSSGEDALEVAIKFDVMLIKFAGKTLL